VGLRHGCRATAHPSLRPALNRVGSGASAGRQLLFFSSAASSAAVEAAPAATAAAARLPGIKSEAEAVIQEAVRSKSLSRKAVGAKTLWKLSKGKLTVWVAISAMPGYMLALPACVEPLTLTALATGTFLTSASAQTMNQIIEIDRDARMHRTAQRPLPSGQMTESQAKVFAAVSGTTGLGILSLGCNPLTAGVAATTMVTYAAMYTPLKVLSPYNTHVGAISGALPTALGFTAALGTGLFASPWAMHAAWLFSMQVLWQMPHFYALAWIHRTDYKRGGYNMFPLTDETGHATAAMSKPYLVGLCALPVAASAAGLASWMLPLGAAVPSYMWWSSLKRFEANPNIATGRKFFLGSLSYLLAVLALFTAYAHVDQKHLVAEGEEEAQKSSVHSDPLWRASIAARLSDLCPHEQMRSTMFDLMKDGCPIPKGMLPQGKGSSTA